MNLPFYIATRYLIAKKSTQAVTLVSWISIFSVAVGCASLIIILSGMNGLTGLVVKLYNSVNPDIKISRPAGKIFSITAEAIAALRVIDGVAHVSKTIEDNMLLQQGDKLQIVKVKGVDSEFAATTRFDTLVKEGVYLSKAAKAQSLLLGKGVAYRLGIDLGDMYDPVTIYCPKKGKSTSINPENSFNQAICQPAGFFSVNDEFDFSYCLSDYKTACTLMDEAPGNASAIEISIVKDAKVREVKYRIQEILGDSWLIQDRFEQNGLLFKTMQTEKLITFIILILVLVIATFNIFGALTMLIFEKSEDIRILSALGAGIILIRRIFMMEGLMIIILGSGIGIFLGYLLCLCQKIFGWIHFENGYIVDAYPIEFHLNDFLSVAAAVALIGFFAAIYPVQLFTRKNMIVREEKL